MYDYAISADQTTLMLKTKTAGYYMKMSANQLLYSQLFSNAVWALTTATLTAGQTDSLAGTEAFTLTATGANATMLQSVSLTVGTLNRTLSIGIKRKTGTGAVSITVDGITYVAQTITAAWVRYATKLIATGTVTAGIKLATSGDEVYIEWAQLEDGDQSGYVTNTASRVSVTQITDVDYPTNTTRGCVNLDGRFFVMTPGCEIYQSALEDVTSWSSLEFIGSQLVPETGVYMTRVGNYIMAMKEWSCEFFYDAANATGSILSPVPNAAFYTGCASDGSVADVAGTIIWLGQNKAGMGRSIYKLVDNNPEKISKISTVQVEKILNTDSLATVYSWFASVGGHQLYGITLVASAVTLIYDMSTNQWSFFTYLATSGAAKTVTAVSTAGVVTSTSHGFSDGDIVLLASTNSSWDGWQIVMTVTTNTFIVQAPSGSTSGTAFSGSGTAQKYTESYFPIVASTSVGGVQYMQHATSGVLYEFDADILTDPIGAIAARIRTPKLDDGNTKFKSIAMVEVIGDKIASTATVRYTDDDFATYSPCRPVDLSVRWARLRRMGIFTRRSFEILHVKNALLRLEALEIEGSE